MVLEQVISFYREHIESCERALQAFMQERGLPDGEAYFLALRANLPQQLFNVTHKVLLAHYKIIADSATFEDYCASLQAPEVRDYFYQRYPVMRAWMDRVAATWVSQSCLLIERLEQDKALIQRDIFGDDAALAIRAIRFGMGDVHRGGRSVAQLEFMDGRKLIYKPRSLQIDMHFAELVRWLCAGSSMELLTPVTLERGHYGWVKFIDPRECVDQAEVDTYYQRLGNWLALLYVLEGTDFHYENIMADGPHPMLIDLESFFHPFTPPAGNDVTDYMDHSILRIGILPSGTEADTSMPDISAIREVDGKKSMVESLLLVDDGKGGIAFERAQGVLEGASNVPRLNGKGVALTSAVITQLQRGFTDMYRVMLERKDALRTQLETFKGDEVRVLFRHTATYGHLLEESTHPTLMRDPKLVEQHFGMLTLIVPGFKAAAKFVDFEIADMLQRDIPLLTSRVGSVDLWYADDGCIPGFFETSGYQGVMSKLDGLSLPDMHHQSWLIEKSLVMIDTLAARKGAEAPPLPAADYASDAGIRQRLIDEAKRVGDYIVSQVHVEHEYANWLVVRSVSIDNSKLDVVPAFYDLYAGMPGEILFLSQLSRLTGEPKYQALADKAINTMLFKVDTSRHIILTVGLYSGWGSIIYALTSLGVARGERKYFDKIEEYFDTVDIGALVALDKTYSLIKGSSGLLLACAEYYMASGSPRALALARQCAEHLVRHRHQGTPGYSWLISSAVPLSGMAHGASGFAMAFARLYEATQEERYREVCLGALDYERSLFVPEQQNWEDCRAYTKQTSQGAVTCDNSWAHGAAGIALARLELIRSGVSNAQVEAELAVALNTTLTHGMSASHSLIAGRFGNLDTLLASAEYGSGSPAASIPRVAKQLLQQIDNEGWCLGSKRFAPLGMLAGVTGIGYQCLRAAFPGQLPSILAARTGATAAALAETS